MGKYTSPLARMLARGARLVKRISSGERAVNWKLVYIIGWHRGAANIPVYNTEKYPGMHNHFMQRAIDLAIENVNGRRGGPFGAVVVRGDAILAEGTNLVTSTLDPTAHAEVTAIRAACRALQSFQLEGCEIYTSCEPCPMCLGAIYWARPDRVYYAGTRADAAAVGFDDAYIYDQLSVPPEKRAIPMLEMMRREAQATFDAWRKLSERIDY